MLKVILEEIKKLSAASLRGRLFYVQDVPIELFLIF